MFQDDWLLIEELRAAGNIISAEDNPDLNVPGKFLSRVAVELVQWELSEHFSKWNMLHNNFFLPFSEIFLL